MSFGRFVCIYGIGYVVTLVVASLTTCIYLLKTYRHLCIRVFERVVSNEDDISWMLDLVRTVCTMLIWPVMIPRNMILLVHECEAEYNKLHL